VEAHAHLQGSARERLLCVGRSLKCARRRGERNEERVSLRVHLDSAVPRDGVANEAPMLRERFRVSVGTELVEELRRALDVREQERDRPGRKLGSHAPKDLTARPCAGYARIARWRSST
jgi:hypothetical protein